MKNDLISRQVAIEHIHSLYPSAPIMPMNRKWWKEKYKPYIEAEKALEMLPSAQPERMVAKWIVTTSLQEGQITWKDYKCSNCSHHREKPMNFCEVCGAKMEGQIYE